jgi:uridine kinase
MQIPKPVILTGKHDSGKTTILRLFFSNLKALSTVMKTKTN